MHYPGLVFSTPDGLLKPGMGRWNKVTQGPLESDKVHLGSSGIRELAMLIKSCVIPPRNSNRNFSGNYERALTHNLHVNNRAPLLGRNV